MPPVKSYPRKSSKRQQTQRTSLTLRRLMFSAAFFGTLLLGLWGYIYAPDLREVLLKTFSKGMARFGFRLEDVVVEGRSQTSKEEILNVLELSRGKPLLSFNLSAAKEKLEKIIWIKEAIIERKLPHTLLVYLIEKVPVAVWQSHGKTYLMDREGDLIETKTPHKHKELLIVAGEFAPQHVNELLIFLSKVPEIKSRITGASYLRSGRWDLKLDGKIDIKLPEKNPERALAYLLTLEQKHRFLTQDIMIVDMRVPGQLILRLTPEALKKQKMKGKHA